MSHEGIVNLGQNLNFFELTSSLPKATRKFSRPNDFSWKTASGSVWVPLSWGCLGGHNSKKKISSVAGHFEGSRSGKEFVSGEGEFAVEERRGANGGITGGKRVNLCTLCSLLMMYLGVHHCKSCKGCVGTWVSLGVYTGRGVALYPEAPRAKNFSFVTVLWRLCCWLKWRLGSFLSVLFCNLN